MEDEPPSAVKPPPRSADLQPVARICNPHAAESSEAPGVSEHPAECNSTVQQTASLRYEPGTRTRPVLGLTMGDPAGVGPELCLRALAEPSVLDVCVPVLFGDVGVLRLAAETCARLAAVPAAATSQTQVPGECETCSAGDVTAAGTAARRAGGGGGRGPPPAAAPPPPAPGGNAHHRLRRFQDSLSCGMATLRAGDRIHRCGLRCCGRCDCAAR